MPRKVFTAGEVLAAADVNSFLMDQTVMSFAGTAARGSAIPTPVNGMTTYIENTRDLTIYDGSTWNGVGGLTLIRTQAVGSAVTNVTVTDVFSSVYDNYLITLTNCVASGANNFLRLQLGATTTGYKWGLNYLLYGSVTPQNPIGNANDAHFAYVGAMNNDSIYMNTILSQPFLNRVTAFSNPFTDNLAGGHVTGVLTNTTSYTGFSFSPMTWLGLVQSRCPQDLMPGKTGLPSNSGIVSVSLSKSPCQGMHFSDPYLMTKARCIRQD